MTVAPIGHLGERPGGRLGRRSVLLALGCSTFSGLGLGSPAPAPRGLVVPRQPAPDWLLTDHRGRRARLTARLQGQVTAVQLMFTGCSSTCPVQGAVFADVAGRIRAKDIGLLSLTVDPLGDDPKALGAWLDRFGRPPGWSAAAPGLDEVEPLASFLRGQARSSHSTQVFLFDRQARLAFRTVDLPSAEHVADLLAQLARA